jgi:hypothetical protein
MRYLSQSTGQKTAIQYLSRAKILHFAGSVSHPVGSRDEAECEWICHVIVKAEVENAGAVTANPAA